MSHGSPDLSDRTQIFIHHNVKKKKGASNLNLFMEESYFPYAVTSLR